MGDHSAIPRKLSTTLAWSTVFNTEQVITWIAVLMRFWVRLRIMREPGWDDALVLLAAILNTAATTLVIVCE